MEKIEVPEIFIAVDRVVSSQEKERVERLLTKIKSSSITKTTAKEIGDIMRQRGWYTKSKRTGQKKVENPSIILSGFNWEAERNNPLEIKDHNVYIPGKFRFADFRDKLQLQQERGVVCNSAYEVHTAFGCFHSCSYCHIGNAFTIMVDVEKFIDNLGKLIDSAPWQKLYKYDNQSDILTLEPEYGATKKLIELFAGTDKYLLLYSKSDNVDHILDLEHKGNTIACWTLSNEEVSKDYELGAPTLEDRLIAAKKCQDAGYRVRYRFSPIIPIANWKEKNSEMIEQIFTETNPEVISLETLCHLTKNQYSEICSGLEMEPQKNITEYELFSHEDRKEMYQFFIKEIRKHSSKTRIALCLETEQMWNDLGDILRGCPDNFYCCCGAKCA